MYVIMNSYYEKNEKKHKKTVKKTLYFFKKCDFYEIMNSNCMKTSVKKGGFV